MQESNTVQEDIPVSVLQANMYKRYTGLRTVFCEGEKRYVPILRVGIQSFDLSEPVDREEAEWLRDMCAKALVNIVVLREYEVP
jgi:hypothetical protein